MNRSYPQRASQRAASRYTVALLILIASLLLPAQPSQAQDTGPLPATPTAIDEEDFDWNAQGSTPFVPKEDMTTPAENADKSQQFEHRLYLPGIETELQIGTAQTKKWYTLMSQDFESIFPSANWSVIDANGPNVGVKPATGSIKWDDTVTKAYRGYWSAHPNQSSVYVNLTDTWMRYGPINLQNVNGKVVTDARFSFYYFLDSEQYYDHFSYEFSCSGSYNWSSQLRSGSSNGTWFKRTISLKECIGSANAYIRFTFRSDYSGTKAGVWVDNILVEKYY